MTQPGARKRVAPSALAPLLTLIALLWTLLPAGPAAAQESEYTVAKIPVDVTAENAAAARDRALLRAQREGLNRLAEKFSVKPPQISEVRATDYVISIEIENEKSSAVRYIANVTVHYNPIAVNRLLNRSETAAAQPVGPPATGASASPEAPPSAGAAPPVKEAVATNGILVIPVYEWSGARSLWDVSNPWYLAWKNAAPTIAGRPTVLPKGEPADLEALTAEQAVARDRAAITALARQYKLVDILVAHATYEVDYRSARPIFRVAVNGFGDRLGGLTLVERVAGEPTEFVDELAKRAVANVAAETERNLGRAGPTAVSAPGPSDRPAPASPALSDGPERSIVANVPLRGPADLGRVRQQIGRLPMMVRDELVSLSRDSATLRLHYRGETEKLRTALADDGLVPEDDGSGWSLRRPVGLNPPAPALR